MYLHLGQDTVVKTEDIVGIFDMDTSTVAKSTRDFLSKKEKEKKVITVAFELPKTFILTAKKSKKEEKIYISQLSSSTLLKRNGNFSKL